MIDAKIVIEVLIIAGLKNNMSKFRECLFETDTFQVELFLNVSNINSWELILPKEVIVEFDK